MSHDSSRWLTAVGVLALLVSGLVADRAVGHGRAAATSAPGPGIPTVAPAGALSSTWYCPAGTAVPNGLADGRIVLANPGDGDLTGTLTVVPSQGQPKSQTVRVPSRARLAFRPGDMVRAPYAAAIVQLDGPTGAVEEQIRGGLGEGVAPCATRASERWYFAAGSTNAGDQMLLSLFNPYPGDAIVDMDFATDTGRATPADLQGVVVPGGGLTVIDVGQHVRRRQIVSAAVTARSGRIVADKIQLQGEDNAPLKGVTLVLGDPAAASLWYFPDGVTAPGVDERYEFFNPGDQEADVQLALILDRGSADPFDVTVAPHDRFTLDVNGENRIPRGVAHAGVVTSSNGAPVVVERVVTAVAPSSRLGFTELMGSPSASTAWLFPVGAANTSQDEWLVAYNPGSGVSHVSVTALLGGRAVPVDGLGNVEIEPSQRVAVRLGDHLSRGDLVLSVSADAPVVVERDLYRIGGLGMSASLGIPGP